MRVPLLHALHTASFLAYTLVPAITVCVHRRCEFRYICGWAWVERSDGVDADLISLQLMVAGATAFFCTQCVIQIRAATAREPPPGSRLPRAAWLCATSAAAFLSWFAFCATIYGEPTAVMRNTHTYASAIAALLTWVFYTALFRNPSLGRWLAFVAGALLAVLAELSFGWGALLGTIAILFSFPSLVHRDWNGKGAIAGACLSIVVAVAILAPTGCFPAMCGRVHNAGYLAVQLALLTCMYGLGAVAIHHAPTKSPPPPWIS